MCTRAFSFCGRVYPHTDLRAERDNPWVFLKCTLDSQSPPFDLSDLHMPLPAVAAGFTKYSGFGQTVHWRPKDSTHVYLSDFRSAFGFAANDAFAPFRVLFSVKKGFYVIMTRDFDGVLTW